MRRPLRHLSRKLQLDEAQTASLAEILADLKTEDAALQVELQRAQKRYADVLKGEAFDAEAAKRANDKVVAAHGDRQTAVSDALAKLHAMLDSEQRVQLSAIVRVEPFLV